MSDSANNIHPSAILGQNVSIGNNVTIGPYSIIHDNVSIEDGCYIDANVVIGLPMGPRPDMSGLDHPPTHIGAQSVVRSGSVIYAGTQTGEKLEVGHHVFILGGCKLGKNVRFHSFCTIKPYCEIGDYARLQNMITLGEYTKIGNYVWIFANVVIANDQYPPDEAIKPVVVHDYAVIALNAIVMPGITIGKESVVAALSLVTRDVPEGMLVMGNPARVIQPACEIRNKYNPDMVPYPWQNRYAKGMPWEGMGHAQWQQSMHLGVEP